MARTSSNTGSQAGAGSIPIEMPRLSSEEGSATLSAWLVAEGDVVEKGTLVAELETDKATVELESPAPGRIEALVVPAGTDGLKPGMLLARIAASGAATTPGAPGPPAAEAVRPAVPSVPTVPTEPAAPPETAPSRSPATPLARRLAEAEGVALEGVQGSGVGGRIEKIDVERLAREAAASKPPDVGALPAAAAMPVESRSPGAAPPVGSVASVASVQRGTPTGSVAPVASVDASAARARGAALPFGMPRPAVQLELRCAMDAVVAARTRLEGGRPAGAAVARALTLNDFVVRAAALALRDVPQANLRRAGDAVVAGQGVDVAVVVASEAGPQVVVLRDADRKGLSVLSAEMGARIEAARSAEPPAPEDPTASLLVTSFGRFGVESAHPMLPPEQVVVLAVGAVVEEPVVRGGQVVVGARMALNLAFDPGAAGGGVMSKLLAAIRRHLEDPLGMML